MSRAIMMLLLTGMFGAMGVVHAADYELRQTNTADTAVRVHFRGDVRAVASVDSGFSQDVLAITTLGTDLILGGKFFQAGGISATRIVGWNGTSWYALPGLPFGPVVQSLHVFNGELHVGSVLQTIYKWTGASWTPVGPDLAPNSSVADTYAMETYNSDLYVAGNFRFDTLQPPYIAKWNGIGWDSVAYGIVGRVQALTLYDGELVAGGIFNTNSGSAGDRIAKWNGTVWSALGSGISPSTGINNPTIFALTVYNGDLIAAGVFGTAGGVAVKNIAKWNGVSWQIMGPGFNNFVFALAVHNSELYAAGAFTFTGGAPAKYIAKWNGAGWSQVGQMDSTVLALHVYNGQLVAGGSFLTTGGGHVAWWDGVNWRPISDISTAVGDDGHTLRPTEFSLAQNYPNPFNPSTAIEFSLSQPSMTQVDIFNIKGQFVARLMDRPLTAGVHKVVWNGKNAMQQEVSSGVYFYRLTTDTYTSSKKMILLK